MYNILLLWKLSRKTIKKPMKNGFYLAIRRQLNSRPISRWHPKILGPNFRHSTWIMGFQGRWIHFYIVLWIGFRTGIRGRLRLLTRMYLFRFIRTSYKFQDPFGFHNDLASFRRIYFAFVCHFSSSSFQSVLILLSLSCWSPLFFGFSLILFFCPFSIFCNFSHFVDMFPD